MPFGVDQIRFREKAFVSLNRDIFRLISNYLILLRGSPTAQFNLV